MLNRPGSIRMLLGAATTATTIATSIAFSVLDSSVYEYNTDSLNAASSTDALVLPAKPLGYEFVQSAVSSDPEWIAQTAIAFGIVSFASGAWSRARSYHSNRADMRYWRRKLY